MEKTKLWRCTFRGKFLAVVRNVESEGLGTHKPDTIGIREALPAYCRHMGFSVWSYKTEIGQSESATVELRTTDGKRYRHSVDCVAYFHEPTPEKAPETAQAKSAGQIAYESDCAAKPSYHDKTKRVPWDKLGAMARESWERNPTPRNWN